MAAIAPIQSRQPEAQTKTRTFVQEAVQKRQLDRPGQVDQQQLSDELMDELGKAEPNSNLDAMLGALGQNFLDQKLGPVETNNKADQKPEQKTETIVDWTPKVKKGEIIGAHAPIGDVVVRERTEGGQDDTQKASPAKGAAKGSGKGPQQANKTAPANKTSTNPNNKAPQTQDDDKDDKGADSVQLSNESQQMAQKMAAQGATVPGVTEPSKNKQSGPKQPGEKIVEQGEITTRCGGVSQTVEVEGQGRLNDQSFLRIYRKLDDMPDDLTVGFNKKTGQEAVEDYAKKLAKGDVTRPLTAQQIDQLRYPTGSQK